MVDAGFNIRRLSEPLYDPVTLGIIGTVATVVAGVGSVVGVGLQVGANLQQAEEAEIQAGENIEEAKETQLEVGEDATDLRADINRQREELLSQQAQVFAAANVVGNVGSALDLAVETNEIIDENIRRVNVAETRAIDDLQDLITRNQRVFDATGLAKILGFVGPIASGAADVAALFETEIAPDQLLDAPAAPTAGGGGSSQFTAQFSPGGFVGQGGLAGLFDLLRGL